MKRVTMLLAFAVCLASLAAAAEEEVGYVEYKEYKLDNGLRVVLSEDHSVPIVVVNIWYHVGSANEDPGRSGFAHLFEHMMFQGSENVGKSDHFKYVSDAGGSANGSTTQDRTNYYEVLPSHRLNLGLWLEADRMRSLMVTDEKFENQRETVKEERRQGVDNQPYGKAFLVADTLAYDYPPYTHSVIGRMADLDAARAEEVQAFFNKYYTPSNAVLVVVGDLDPEKTMNMIEEYFGDIPGRTAIPKLKGTEPISKGERRSVVDSPKANVPALFLGYNTPETANGDTPALELLSKILFDGESSRLHKRLVKDEEAAFAVFGFYDGRLGPSLFRIIAAANAGVDIGVSERLIFEEIEKLQKEGISEEELNKAKVKFKTDFIQSRQTVMGKAEAIQSYLFFYNDLARINRDLDDYMKVTKDDLARVANKYLGKDNRTAVIALPPQKETS